MNRTYLRALSAAFAVAAASLSMAEGWVNYCDDPATTTPLWSTFWGGNGVGTPLFATTMETSGGQTATYECYNPIFTGEGPGGINFNIGSLGSVQTPDDEFTELIMGGAFGYLPFPDGSELYGPLGARADWSYMATVRQGDTDANPTLTKFGKAAFDTVWNGASDRYFIAQCTQDNIRVELRVDGVGDAGRLEWHLTNLSGTATNIGMWFGQVMLGMGNFDLTPKPYFDVQVPGYKPLTIQRRFVRNPNSDPNVNPREYPLPDYVDFYHTQARAWEGLRCINSPSVALDGPYPDQTQVDGFDIGLDGWLLGAQPGNDGLFPDALENDVNIDASPAYIQKWNPIHVEGNARPVSERRVVIVSYYKTTWGDDSFAKPYSVVLDTPKVIGVQDSNPFQFIRSPATLRVYVDNIRGYTTAEKMIAIENALVTLTLPQGMGDANDITRRVISKTISNIQPRQMKFVDFQIASLPTTFGVQEVQVKIQPQPGPTRVVTGQIVVASQPYLQISQNANLVTAPWQFSNSNWASILGSGPNPMQPDVDYQAFAWDPVSQDYTIQTSPQRGIGNWLISTQDFGFKQLAGNPQTPQDLGTGAPLIELAGGWNLIANPYNYPIPLGQIVGVPGSDNANTYTYQELVDRGSISGSLAYWDPGTQSYKFIGSPSDLMQPNTGYWIDVLDPQGVVFSYPPVYLPFVPIGSGGIMKPSKVRDLPPTKGIQPVWTSNLVVKAGRAIDRQTEFGMVAKGVAARKGFVYEPPMAPIKNTVSAAFKVDDKRRGASLLARQLTQEQDAQAYTLMVNSNKDGLVSIQWPQIANVPAKYDVILRDTVSGARINMRTAEMYSFDAKARVMRELKVIVRVHVDSIVNNLSANKIGSAYNDPVAVGYNLAIPAQATVNIYQGDTLIKTITDRASEDAGKQQSLWDLKNSSGARVPAGAYKATVIANDGDKTETKSVLFYVN